MAFCTIIAGCVCFVDASDIHRIDIHVVIHHRGVLTLTARDASAIAADDAHFVSSVRALF
jgi:hypothetical protein